MLALSSCSSWDSENSVQTGQDEERVRAGGSAFPTHRPGGGGQKGGPKSD